MEKLFFYGKFFDLFYYNDFSLELLEMATFYCDLPF